MARLEMLLTIQCFFYRCLEAGHIEIPFKVVLLYATVKVELSESVAEWIMET